MLALLELAPAALPAAAGSASPGALSYVCGECHRDIYRTWRQSAHSRSLENIVFLDTFRDTEARRGRRQAMVCLRCHAPLAPLAGDAKLELQASWEGVNCDFCHSLVAVDASSLEPKIEVGNVKRGPIRDASSVGHEVAYSELHATSLVCAPCHEYVNAEGTPILTTYSEWKASSSAAEGRHCQACHMGLTRAYVVDPKIQRVSHAEVNLHEVPGGHSLKQLHEALSLNIRPSRASGEVVLDLTLTNRGAGHAVPTGMPGRRVILDVRLEASSGHSFAERQVFEKRLIGAGGEPVTQDSDCFAEEIRVESDTRIRADEERSLQFRFPVSASATAFVTVKLHYEHSPKGREEDRTWITFLSESRIVQPEPPPDA